MYGGLVMNVTLTYRLLEIIKPCSLRDLSELSLERQTRDVCLKHF
jgi:hypothetical protein